MAEDGPSLARALDAARHKALTGGWPVLKFIKVRGPTGTQRTRAFVISTSGLATEVPLHDARNAWKFAMRATRRDRKRRGLDDRPPPSPYPPRRARP